MLIPALASMEKHQKPVGGLVSSSKVVEECTNLPGGIGGDAMSGGAQMLLQSAPPHQDDVGIVGLSLFTRCKRWSSWPDTLSCGAACWARLEQEREEREIEVYYSR